MATERHRRVVWAHRAAGATDLLLLTGPSLALSRNIPPVVNLLLWITAFCASGHAATAGPRATISHARASPRTECAHARPVRLSRPLSLRHAQISGHSVLAVHAGPTNAPFGAAVTSSASESASFFASREFEGESGGLNPYV